VSKSRFANAVDLLEAPALATNDKLSGRIQAARTKATNVKARYSRYKADATIPSQELGGLLDALRKDIEHLAIAPASDKAYDLWQDYKAEQEAEDKKADPYFVFLAKGAESRARMWEMMRLVDALMETGLSQEESVEKVYFIHEESVAQYREQVARYNRLVELLG